jgi:adenosylcobyric acid synthase
VSGYEIHMGLTTYLEAAQPFARIFRRGGAGVNVPDGCVSGNGRIFGTYLHGLFDNAAFRTSYLNLIRREKGLPLRQWEAEHSAADPFERLADHLEQHLDMQRLLAICGLDRDRA